MKKKTRSVAVKAGINPLQKKRRRTLTTIIILLALAVVGALALTMLGQGNFDLRQQASVNKGLVKVNFSQFDGISHPIFKDGSRRVDYGFLSVPLYVNTYGSNIRQLKLDIRLNNWNGMKITNLSFKANPNQDVLENLVLVEWQANKNILTLDFQVEDPNTGFSSGNSGVQLGSIDFTIEKLTDIKYPDKSLGFSLSTYRVNSQAFLVGAEKDVLEHVEPVWFTMRAGSINPEDNDARGRQCYSDVDCAPKLICDFSTKDEGIGVCGEKIRPEVEKAKPVLVKCYSDADCAKNQICAFSEQVCPEGVDCPAVMSGYCAAIEFKAIDGVELK